MLQSCPAPDDSMEMMAMRKEEQFSWKVGVKLFLCFWLRTGVAEKRGIKSWNQMEKQAMSLAVWCSAFRERAARPHRSSVEAFSFWKTHTPHTDSRHHRTLSHTGGLTDGSLVRETRLLWRRVCVCICVRSPVRYHLSLAWRVTRSQHCGKGGHLFNNSWLHACCFGHYWYRLTHSRGLCHISSQLWGQASKESERLKSRHLRQGVSHHANRTHNHWHCRETCKHKTYELQAYVIG